MFGFIYIAHSKSITWLVASPEKEITPHIIHILRVN